MKADHESLLRCLHAIAGASIHDPALPHELLAIQDLRAQGHIVHDLRTDCWALTLGGKAWVNYLEACQRAELVSVPAPQEPTK